jgi:hypothetical protein
MVIRIARAGGVEKSDGTLGHPSMSGTKSHSLKPKSQIQKDSTFTIKTVK